MEVTPQEFCLICDAPSFFALCESCEADAIKRRLDKLKTADMPWLTPAGLASIKDAPEQSGPREYVKPKGWK